MENEVMLENNPPPLTIASRVLSPETLAALRRSEMAPEIWTVG
ncbi:hypothetical protein [Caballeronia sp. Lep1P3]|nr:hypothetical protein [Caballeronia sp. Lep1P3]